MAIPIVECVPNFSEGRDRAVVESLASAIAGVSGVRVLDIEMDADHNRSVITCAGAPEAVVDAAVAAARVAVNRIDLTRHQGVHPRIGALDVLPFVPIEGVNLEDCAALAWRAGLRLWEELGVPVYFYEAAAKRPERRRLEDVRRGQFEGLREAALTDPARRPDAGGPGLHPTAGATAVGARKVLIAWNINLDTDDVETARAIARAIRASSGGLPCVKALGVRLASRGVAQVTMNLTDFETTPMHVVYEAVRREAKARGAGILSSEIIGLMPRKAIEMAAAHFLKFENFRAETVLERRLEEAAAQPLSSKE
jgi:glutamate formiminotransferase